MLYPRLRHELMSSAKTPCQLWVAHLLFSDDTYGAATPGLPRSTSQLDPPHGFAIFRPSWVAHQPFASTTRVSRTLATQHESPATPKSAYKYAAPPPR